MASIRVSGVSELIRNLGWSKNAMPKAMTSAMNMALTNIENDARAIIETEVYGIEGKTTSGVFYPHPPRSGDLRDAFYHYINKVSTSGIEGIVDNSDWKAAFFEFGTGIHGPGGTEIDIVPHGLYLKFLNTSNSAFVFKRLVTNPGIVALHFMQRAVEMNVDEVNEIFARYALAAMTGPYRNALGQFAVPPGVNELFEGV
jgi:hypothetical protein